MEQLIHHAATVAYAAAIAAAATFVTGILFFMLRGIMGPINDIAAVFYVVLMALVAIIFHQQYGSRLPVLGLVAVSVLLVSAIASVFAQLALLFQVINFEQNMRYAMPAGIGIGLWAVLVGWISWKLPMFNAWQVGLAFVSGLAYIAMAFAYWRGGQSHPLFMSGSIIGLFSYTGWCWLFGKMLAK